MGSRQSMVYSVELPGQEQPPNCTKIRRHPSFVNGLWHTPKEGITTMSQIFLNTFANYPNSNCFGTISQCAGNEQQNDKPQRTLEFLTYRDVELKVHALASAMIELNLAPAVKEAEGLKLVGVYSKNRAEWMLVDIASCLYGFTTVPLYDTLGPENISYVLNHSGVQSLFCSGDSCKTIAATTNIGQLKIVVSFDPLSDELADMLSSKGIHPFQLDDLLEMGSLRPSKPPTVSPQNIVTFSYTSGTTGSPKAVMISQANFLSCCAILQTKPDVRFYPTDVYLSYLPLPHVLERIYMYGVLSVGGQVCFYSGDVQKLKDDIELVRPTVFASVPRIYNRFYDGMKTKFDQATGLQKMLLDKALSTKMENVLSSGSFSHSLYDKLVFSKTREAMGGRLRLMTSGSAPILPHVHSFMKVVMACPLIEGFGQTETTGVTFATDALDPTTGHVGGPTSNVEFKLEDIPEMNYTHKDLDAQGRPSPRGEICVRGPGVFVGYYKDPVKTSEAIDKEGWFHSGDVGCILPKSGALKIIDRKKNIFKLQHGEYVATEKVESIYLKQKEVAEMFLHGDSTQAFAVAILVPDLKAIEELAKQLKISGSVQQLCRNHAIRSTLLRKLHEVGRKEGLQSFEQPKNLYLEPASFQAKGILTSTMKLQRFQAKKLYQKEIAEMYKEGMILGKDK